MLFPTLPLSLALDLGPPPSSSRRSGGRDLRRARRPVLLESAAGRRADRHRSRPVGYTTTAVTERPLPSQPLGRSERAGAPASSSQEGRLRSAPSPITSSGQASSPDAASGSSRSTCPFSSPRRSSSPSSRSGSAVSDPPARRGRIEPDRPHRRARQGRASVRPVSRPARSHEIGELDPGRRPRAFHSAPPEFSESAPLTPGPRRSFCRWHSIGAAARRASGRGSVRARTDDGDRRRSQVETDAMYTTTTRTATSTYARYRPSCPGITRSLRTRLTPSPTTSNPS